MYTYIIAKAAGIVKRAKKYAQHPQWTLRTKSF